jgi:uncharacterized protein YqjF (DUF2071 family)
VTDSGQLPIADRGRGVLRMRWHDLLFAHWPIPAETLRPLIPSALEVDTFDGSAWLGVVPFRMSAVGPVGGPTPPILGRFGEVNVRTYVRHRDRPGIWFFSLDAASLLTVLGARAWFHLPYRLAAVSCRTDPDGVVTYRSRRALAGPGDARLAASYRPVAPIEVAAIGSLIAFLTERPSLYAADRHGRIYRGDVRHGPWPLQAAEAELREESLIAAAGLVRPATAPILSFARRLDVVATWPVRIA